MRADVGKPEDVKALFAETKKAFGGRLDFLFNNAGFGAPPVPMEELPFETVEVGGRRHPARLVPVRAGGDQDHEIADAQGRPHRQQRLDLRLHAATQLRRLHRLEHAITGLTKCIALDGRKHDIACGQLDIGNADTAMGGRMKAGVPQASGEIKPEPVFDVEHCGSAIRYMASLPLDTNVLFMNIKATKMPFEGRG